MLVLDVPGLSCNRCVGRKRSCPLYAVWVGFDHNCMQTPTLGQVGKQVAMGSTGVRERRIIWERKVSKRREAADIARFLVNVQRTI